jgi:hypothetical protein
MKVPKEEILELLRDKGEHGKAAQAERELPDKVDHDQHSDLLSRFGIDPKELVGKFGGQLGGKLGL